MKFSCVLLTALAVSTLGATVAHADTFDFSFGTAASKFSGFGVLTGYEVSAGEYQITGITGTTDTGNGKNRKITTLESPGTFDSNDNLLFAAAGGGFTFDVEGLSYGLKNGAEINIFTDLGVDTELLQRANGNLVQERRRYSVTAVTPEPGSIVLLGTGLLGAVGAARRRLFA